MLTIRLLMASTLSLGFTQAASISVTVCAQNSYTLNLTCEGNTTGALITRTVNASGTNGNPNVINTSQASASARVANFGQLGVAASTHWYNPGNSVLTDSALANASVSDRLFIAGASSGTVSLTYALSGTGSHTYPLLSGNNAGWLLFRSSVFSFQGVDAVNPPTSITFTAPFSGGQFAYNLQFEAAFRMYNINVYDADYNFLNTASLNLVEVRDSLGNLVANPGLTSESGFNYGQFTGVPEPSTYALAAAGLALVLRRRKLPLKKLALVAVTAAGCFATPLGPSPIDRAFVDGASGGIYLFNGFLTAGEQVSSYQIFNNNPANTNWITPLLLDFQSGNNFQIIGIGTSRQNTGAGLQTYSFGLVSGTDQVTAADQVFGWWNGRINGVTFTQNTGVIEFDTAVSNPGFRESCPAPNVGPCNFNPSVNLILPFANNYTQAGGGLGAPGGRVYSVQVTTLPSPIPEPSTWLTAAGAIAVALLRRRR